MRYALSADNTMNLERDNPAFLAFSSRISLSDGWQETWKRTRQSSLSFLGLPAPSLLPPLPGCFSDSTRAILNPPYIRTAIARTAAPDTNAHTEMNIFVDLAIKTPYILKIKCCISAERAPTTAPSAMTFRISRAMRLLFPDPVSVFVSVLLDIRISYFFLPRTQTAILQATAIPKSTASAIFKAAIFLNPPVLTKKDSDIIF